MLHDENLSTEAKGKFPFSKELLAIFLNTHRSEKSPIPAKRIQNIIEFLTYEVFKYSCRGLYENHKFLFTLLLALKIDIQGGKVRVQEFQTLIKGNEMLILFIILGPFVERVQGAID